MALATLFDDFPIIAFDNGGYRRRQRPRPLLLNLLDSLEDTLDQKVGHVFRRLPSALLDVEDDYDIPSSGRKRKVKSGALSAYEPKSKVLISSKDNKFKISVDASSYQPDEITVKIVNDKIAISAKHEAKGKDVYEFSEMYRSFDLPDNVDPDSITSHLSSSGELTVEAPLKALKDAPAARNIPVSIEGKEQQAVESSKSPSKEKKSE